MEVHGLQGLELVQKMNSFRERFSQGGDFRTIFIRFWQAIHLDVLFSPGSHNLPGAIANFDTRVPWITRRNSTMTIERRGLTVQ